MSTEENDTGGTILDAPNKEAVGLDPPWVEGSGGSADPEPAPAKASRKAAKTDDDAENGAEDEKE